MKLTLYKKLLVPAAVLAAAAGISCSRPAAEEKGAASVEEVKQVLSSSTKNVLLDFWAPWCGPCVAMAPVVEQAAEEFADRLELVKVNIDELPELAEEYKIEVIPTFIIIERGNVESVKIGGMPPQEFKSWIQQYL